MTLHNRHNVRKPYVADDGDMLKSQFLRDTEWAMILCKIPTKKKKKEIYEISQ